MMSRRVAWKSRGAETIDIAHLTELNTFSFRNDRVMESINAEVIAAHNLTPEEFNRLKELLGREPNLVELGLFSVMWSEHCSYKSSRVHLKRLPTNGERVIVPPGENAGIV